MSIRYYKYAYAVGGVPGNPPVQQFKQNLILKNVSRPYKQKITMTQGGNTISINRSVGAGGNPPRTIEERVTACKARVTDHINRVNTHPNIPAARKTIMIQKLNTMLVGCSTPRGLDDEERDKDHKHVDNLRQGQGRLVSQITPGKLRKEPNVLDSLIKAIWDFFASITNRPEVVDRFMAKYPKPAATT